MQHLVTADESSLVELEMLLATLPLCATGRVFIEIPDASHEAAITVPARMTVTWLARDRRTGAPGSCRSCTNGEALSRAVGAWVDEMMCDEDDDTTVTLLGGFLGTAEIVDHLLTGGVDAERIHAPERFGLLPR